ncbi:hypothetical protein [Pseudovibrio exalbescens]|nr:hypothetical protein [Pseudovibrio exalbescens]
MKSIMQTDRALAATGPFSQVISFKDLVGVTAVVIEHAETDN